MGAYENKKMQRLLSRLTENEKDFLARYANTRMDIGPVVTVDTLKYLVVDAITESFDRDFKNQTMEVKDMMESIDKKMSDNYSEDTEDVDEDLKIVVYENNTSGYSFEELINNLLSSEYGGLDEYGNDISFKLIGKPIKYKDGKNEYVLFVEVFYKDGIAWYQKDKDVELVIQHSDDNAEIFNFTFEGLTVGFIKLETIDLEGGTADDLRSVSSDIMDKFNMFFVDALYAYENYIDKNPNKLFKIKNKKWRDAMDRYFTPPKGIAFMDDYDDYYTNDDLRLLKEGGMAYFGVIDGILYGADEHTNWKFTELSEPNLLPNKTLKDNFKEYTSTQLEKGIKAESEHEDLYDEMVALFNGVFPMSKREFYKKIAMAHIKEMSNYYDKLEEMEGKKTYPSDNVDLDYDESNFI